MANLREPVAIGVIGAGFIAQVAHLPAFARLKGCRLSALADNRSGLLELVADRHGIPSRFMDYRDLLADGGVDAVIVTMPRHAQSAVVRDVIEAHLPVLTEKPMAYTVKVAKELVELARLGGTALAVGYMRLFDPGVRLYRALLDEAITNGEMGKLLHVRMIDFCGAYSLPVPYCTRSYEKKPFRYEEDPSTPEFVMAKMHAAYDYTVNVGSHDINLLQALFGYALKPVSFRVRPEKAQHAVFAAHEFDVELSIGPAGIGTWEQRLDAYFEKGCLSLVLDSPLNLQAYATVIRRRPSGEEILRPTMTELMFAFDLQAADFVEALRDGTPVVADGCAALRDIEGIEALWRIVNIAS